MIIIVFCITSRSRLRCQNIGDFVFILKDKSYLENVQKEIQIFLENNLKLNLHPYKVFIKTLYSGLDFLGFVHFPKYRILRTVTKTRMFKKLKQNNFKEDSVNSYLGLLRYGNSFKIQKEILEKLCQK